MENVGCNQHEIVAGTEESSLSNDRFLQQALLNLINTHIQGAYLVTIRYITQYPGNYRQFVAQDELKAHMLTNLYCELAIDPRPEISSYFRRFHEYVAYRYPPK